MNVTKTLLVLLVIQVALGVLTWWPEDRSKLAPRPLLALEEGDIRAIEIVRNPLEGEEPDPMRLVREEDGWQVASSGHYPATPDKVEDLLDHLLGLEVRAPIAMQETSYDALKVGDEEYGRRVSIETSEGEIDLVVGAATGQSIHVRVVGEPEVYVATGLSEWSLRDRGASYYDSQLVSADPERLLSFSVHRDSGDLLFTRSEDGWQLDGVPEGAVLDADKVSAFIEEATSLRLTEPVGREDDESYGLGDGTRVAWSFEDESQTVGGGYVIGAEDGNDSYVRAAGSDYIVKASNSRLDPVRVKTVADFTSDDG